MTLDAVLYSRAFFARQLVIEGAGLFWLGAEVAILFGALLARHHLETTPGCPRLAFQRRDALRAIGWAAVFLLFSAVVLGRHFVLAQPQHLEDIEVAAVVLQARHREHLAVWAAFVAGWVALEAMIVYHGYRGYMAFRKAVDARVGA
jgi:hypothetical protein